MVNQSAHSLRCVLDLTKVVPCGTPCDGGRADIFATFGACGASLRASLWSSTLTCPDIYVSCITFDRN